MGYTHYFSKVKETRDDSLRFEMFANDVSRIIDYAVINYGIEIADACGENLGKWEVSKEFVSLNGFGENSHETFYLDKDFSGFNFCKTARKPYDAVVTACLIHLKDCYGDAVTIGSDGDWSDLEWKEGASLYRNATGRDAENPMTNEKVEV
jgi:hypothetical protein